MYKLLAHLMTDLELSPEPGSIVVLTGENGIGKSTYLSSLRNRWAGQYKIAFCDQSPLEIFFDRELKKYREILLKDSPVIDKIFFETFWPSLSAKENRLLSHLSGGEGQLVKLISVCSSEAEVYLLDEPGHYLDREKKMLVNGMIKMLVGKKKSVIIVEHDVSWIPSGALIKELRVHEGILQEGKSWTI
jgi:energy-coupling factor transporter ATP-binding protein EcfA2